MSRSVARIVVSTSCFAVALVVSTCPVAAVQSAEVSGRFDVLVKADPDDFIDVATTPVESLSVNDRARSGWAGFRAEQGHDWRIYLDRRSGVPLLAEGSGIPWPVKGATSESLAASVRAFIADHRALLMAEDAELVFDPAASGLLFDDVWQIVFRRAVAGIPVDGERYVFTIGHGKLISFGSPRWSRIDASPEPSIKAADAQARVISYMKLTATDTFTVATPPQLAFAPLRASGSRYAGPVGAGYGSALVWRLALKVEGDPGLWLARVDAHTGAIRSFIDDVKHIRVKGGVYPLSSDQMCPTGCEQPNFAMPYANVTVNGVLRLASTMGNFACTPASAVATTSLTGPYVKITDQCGAISESHSCSGDLDLATGAGNNCAVPSGTSSLGNTHAARTSFYHVNRLAEHARTWLPSVAWLTQQVTVVVNYPLLCNASWFEGSIYMGSGRPDPFCLTAGENASIVDHEWGHGLDQNDGGDFDAPLEGTADVTALLATHVSCLGRGFTDTPCTNNGDTCLTCTGVREDDWDQRVGHTPATPAGYVAPRCSPSDQHPGPCGYGVYCEGIVVGETIWDLAVRDLPASGLDANSSWGVADRLWYRSRLGSGGNAYNCSLPDSDGCSATSWFEKFRAVDDDDGDLANGTPHAAAIFAAFDRHGIACGSAVDPSNQSSSACPVFATPLLKAVPASSPAMAQLTWTKVPNAASYRILRNDLGCASPLTRVATTTATSLLDTNLANGVPVFYSVQAGSGNEACDGRFSNCQQVTPQPFAGVISLDAPSYGCSGSVITVEVTDGNVGAPPTASVVSTTETTPEVVTLVRIAPGSTTYRGTITTTTSFPVHDGALSVATGDMITATYTDASDGGGGLNIPRVATATAACANPSVRPVADGTFGEAMRASRGNPAGTAINLTWDVATCLSADHHVIYGDLANVGTVVVSGAACNLGTSGSAFWTGVPAGSLWFVVVGDDDAATEGSWGKDHSGVERAGATASGLCGMTTRNNSGSCP